MDDQPRVRYVKGRDGVLRGPYPVDNSADRTLKVVLSPGLYTKWKRYMEKTNRENESQALSQIIEKFLSNY